MKQAYAASRFHEAVGNGMFKVNTLSIEYFVFSVGCANNSLAFPCVHFHVLNIMS